MLTVPTLIRAAANGLGGFLGETYEERAARERARIAHETAMRNAAANATASSPSGPRAPLPPGTVKTPWQAAADAAGNIFGSGVTTPPGTTAEADAADDTITSATPPINSSGAPNWGLFVGLGILVIGGGALAWSLWGRKSAAPAANRRRRRRNAGSGRRVPGISAWSTLYGGTAGAGRSGYHWGSTGRFALYSIQPTTNQYGRFTGYTLYNNELMRWIGNDGQVAGAPFKFRSPQAAASAANRHAMNG